MQEGVIVISQKELTRYDVLRRVLDGTISLTDAAGYMGVSYRQAKRLKQKAQQGAGLVHGNRGRSPASRVDGQTRLRILELSRNDYASFNDTHFTEEWYGAETWASDHRDDPDVETVLKRVRESKTAYLRWGRETLGWAIYVFRKGA